MQSQRLILHVAAALFVLLPVSILPKLDVAKSICQIISAVAVFGIFYHAYKRAIVNAEELSESALAVISRENQQSEEGKDFERYRIFMYDVLQYFVSRIFVRERFSPLNDSSFS